MAEQIISKRCSKCKEIKPISEFCKNKNHKDGHSSSCKTCKKDYRQSEKGKAAIKRYKQSVKYKAKEKKHRQTEKRKVYQRDYGKTYWKSKKGKAAIKRYRQSEKGKATLRTAAKRFHNRHPNYIYKKATSAVYSAIRVGRLSRPDSLQCSCGNQAAHYHHHKGYAPEHWLDVVPICIGCHKD